MTRKVSEDLEYLHGVKALSATERKFMKIIWQHPEGISSEQVYSSFPQAFSTKTTIMHRIFEKGYIEVRQEGKHFIYTPKFTELEYERALLLGKMKKNFGIASLENFISAFCGRKELTEKEKERISNLLNDLQKK